MKVEYKKEWKHLYATSKKEVSVVDVPPLNYLMIDGKGDPNTSPDYQAALEALYGTAYTLKFHLKKLGLYKRQLTNTSKRPRSSSVTKRIPRPSPS